MPTSRRYPSAVAWDPSSCTDSSRRFAGHRPQSESSSTLKHHEGCNEDEHTWLRDDELEILVASWAFVVSDDFDQWDPESQLEQNEHAVHAEKRPCVVEGKYNFASVAKLLSKMPWRSIAIDLEAVKVWLACYVQFTRSSANQEKLLKLLQWSLWMAGAGWKFITLDDSDASAWLIKLSADVCYARYVTRLLGLPSAMEGAVNGSWACSSNNERLDTLYHVIGTVLACLMIAYYPTELVAFCLWMKPTEAMASGSLIFDWPADTWFIWSMRFWLAYLLTELVQSLVQCLELHTQRVELTRTKKTRDERQSQLLYLDKQIYDTGMLMVCDALYLLPCMYWSSLQWHTESWLSVELVNTLMWTESVVCIYHAVQRA